MESKSKNENVSKNENNGKNNDKSKNKNKGKNENDDKNENKGLKKPKTNNINSNKTNNNPQIKNNNTNSINTKNTNSNKTNDVNTEININKNKPYLDLIHTGHYINKLQKNIDYDPKILNFEGYELLEYDPPSDNNCWIWAFIPVFLSQILYDDNKYKVFVNKINNLPEYLNNAHGLKLTEEENQIRSKTLEIVQKLKNKEGTIKELDKDQTLIKFFREITLLILNAEMINTFYSHLDFLKTHLKDTDIFKKITENTTLKIVEKGKLNIKNLSDDLREIEKNNYKLYSNNDKLVSGLSSIYFDIIISNKLNNSKISWGEPSTFERLSSYFKLVLLSIYSESQWNIIKNGFTFGNRFKNPIKPWNFYFKDYKSPIIFMRYVNENHYRYVVLEKK